MPKKRREIPWLQVRNETYYVFWYCTKAGRTKRLSLGVAATETLEAQKRFAAFLSEGHAAFTSGPARLTVRQACADYMREHVAQMVVDKKRAQTTVDHLIAWFKDDAISDIDIPACRAYADARRTGVIGGGKRRKTKEAADSTIRRELISLGTVANHAAKWKRIGPKANPPTPMPSIDLPQLSNDQRITSDSWLTKAELARAIETAPAKLRDFMVIAYDCAGRRRSVERLTKFQVDLARSQVNLTSPTETANERRSKKRRPITPITARARPVYERLMTATSTEFLFGAPSDMYFAFRRHMESIGLGHKRNPHILRHSRASHLLQDGVTLFAVAKLLGDTVATTERVYGHHSVEYVDDAIARASQ